MLKRYNKEQKLVGILSCHLRKALSLSVFILLLLALPAFSDDRARVGSCGLACDCVEDAMNNKGDADEKFPVDRNPLKDDGSSYELKEVGEPDLNKDESASYVVIEEWTKTPKEILNEQLSTLSPEGLSLYYFLLDGNGIGNSLPSPAVSGFWGRLIAQGIASGPYHYNIGGSHYYYYSIKLGNKNCFFSTTVRNRYLDQASLSFCLPHTYLNGDPNAQLDAHFDNGSAITQAVGIMDFIVGMAPFLGTADLVFNQKILTDIYEGRLDKMANLCGSVAGDFFAIGKALKLARAGVASTKIVQGATFATGCGSVLATGGYLYTKGRGEGLDPQDAGQAVFMGLEIIGLILDKPAHDLIKSAFRRRFFKRKKPAATCLSCGPKCPLPRDDIKNIDLEKTPLKSIHELTTCKSQCPVGLSESQLEALEEEIRKKIMTISNPDEPGVPFYVDMKVTEEANALEIRVDIDGIDIEGDLSRKGIANSRGQFVDDPKLGKYLWIDMVEMVYFYKGQRISELLLGRIIHFFEKICVSVKRIRSEMAGDNGNVYWEALSKGMTPLEAVKQTPAYKVRVKFGYALDIENSILPDLSKKGKVKPILGVIKP